MKRTLGLAVSIFLWFMTSAWADTTPGGGEVAAMEEVVVTATRDREPVRRVAANVTVITAQQIEASGASSLIDVLGKLESVNIRDYSGSSPQSIIDIRGFGGDNPFGKVLVMLDGRRLNRPDMASVNWLNIPLGQIDRVEVVRGAGTVLYGDAAIGGVIQIFTKQGRGTPRFDASVQMGSHGLHDERVGATGSLGRMSYALTAGNQLNWGYRERSKSSSSGGGLNLGYEAGDYIRLSAGASMNRSAYDFPGALTAKEMAQDRRQYQPGNPNDDGQDREVSAQIGLEAILGHWGRLDLGFRYGDRTSTANMDSWWLWTKTDMRTYSLNPQYILEKDILGRANKFTAGVDWFSEPYRKDFFADREQGIKKGWADLKKDGLGYYVRDEFHLLKNLILSEGYRTERTSIGGSHVDRVTPANNFSDQEKTYSAEAFEMGLTWLIGKRSKVFGKYGTVYRMPFVDETASFNGAGGGFVRTLEKEKGASMEAGAQFHPLENLRVGLTLFRIDMSDEIQYVGIFPTGYNQNAGKTRHEGAEFSFSWLWEKRARLYGNATYHKATFEDGISNKKEMPLVPNRMANLGLEVFLPWNLTVRPEMRHVSDAFLLLDNANSGDKLEAYTLFSLYLFYRPRVGKVRMQLFCGVDNLTNVKYASFGMDQRPWLDNCYYPSPGVTYKGGLSLAF
jgi:iron complex outermembrane receptor protein